jgi:hypothetical protein
MIASALPPLEPGFYTLCVMLISDRLALAAGKSRRANISRQEKLRGSADR